MREEILLIHIEKRDEFADIDGADEKEAFEKDYEIMDFIANNKELQKQLKDNRLPAVVIDQTNVH